MKLWIVMIPSQIHTKSIKWLQCYYWEFSIMVASFDIFESQNISYLDIYLPSIHVPSSNLSAIINQTSQSKVIFKKILVQKASSRYFSGQGIFSQNQIRYFVLAVYYFFNLRWLPSLIPWFFKMRESSCFPRKTIYVTAQFSRSSHNNNQNVSLVLLHPLARTMSGRDFLGNDNAKGSKRWRRLGTISSQFHVLDDRSLKDCKLPTTSCPKP